MKTTILTTGLAMLLISSCQVKTELESGATKTVAVSAERKEALEVETTSRTNGSEEPLETINRWFGRFKAGASAEELASFYHENAVMWIPGDTANIPWVGKRTGRADIAAHYKVLWKNIKSESLVITDMLSKGNRVVVLGHLKSRYLANNKLVDSDFCMNIIVENGLIQSYNFLEDSFDVAAKVKGTKPIL